MGLDVGVVTFEYLPEPQPPVHDFLCDMLLDPYTGIDEEYEDDRSLYEEWSGRWDNNGMYEFSHDGLISRARNWADDHSMGESAKNDLLSWVEELPWQNDMVSLHLGA